MVLKQLELRLLLHLEHGKTGMTYNHTSININMIKATYSTTWNNCEQA